MITVIAVLCSLAAPADCHTETVSSGPSMDACMVGIPQIAEWMKGRPAYRLAGWRCVMGTPAVRA